MLSPFRNYWKQIRNFSDSSIIQGPFNKFRRALFFDTDVELFGTICIDKGVKFILLMIQSWTLSSTVRRTALILLLQWSTSACSIEELYPITGVWRIKRRKRLLFRLVALRWARRVRCAIIFATSALSATERYHPALCIIVQLLEKLSFLHFANRTVSDWSRGIIWFAVQSNCHMQLLFHFYIFLECIEIKYCIALQFQFRKICNLEN